MQKLLAKAADSITTLCKAHCSAMTHTQEYAKHTCCWVFGNDTHEGCDCPRLDCLVGGYFASICGTEQADSSSYFRSSIEFTNMNMATTPSCSWHVQCHLCMHMMTQHFWYAASKHKYVNVFGMTTPLVVTGVQSRIPYVSMCPDYLKYLAYLTDSTDQVGCLYLIRYGITFNL